MHLLECLQSAGRDPKDYIFDVVDIDEPYDFNQDVIA